MKGGESMYHEKPIENFKGYGITNTGLVISYKMKNPKILKGFINKGGYIYVDLCENNKTTRLAVHRLVAKAFVDGWFENAVVNHKDGNTLNNHYTNLEWVTQTENIHQGYKTSGINAMRHYCYHVIVYPDGTESEPLAGQQSIKDYISEHKLDVSFNSLLRNGRSRGFKLYTLH